jgi:hypothetical protein
VLTSFYNMLEERGVEIFKVYIVCTFIDVLVLSLQRKAMLEFLHFFNILLRIKAYHDTRRSPNYYGLILECLSTTLTKCSLYKAFQSQNLLLSPSNPMTKCLPVACALEEFSSRRCWYPHSDLRWLASACNRCSVLWPCDDQSWNLVRQSDSRELRLQ